MGRGGRDRVLEFGEGIYARARVFIYQLYVFIYAGCTRCVYVYGVVTTPASFSGERFFNKEEGGRGDAFGKNLFVKRFVHCWERFFFLAEFVAVILLLFDIRKSLSSILIFALPLFSLSFSKSYEYVYHNFTYKFERSIV